MRLAIEADIDGSTLTRFAAHLQEGHAGAGLHARNGCQDCRDVLIALSGFMGLDDRVPAGDGISVNFSDVHFASHVLAEGNSAL